MSTDVIKTVAGRPVTGEKPRSYRSSLPEQKPIEDFVAALDTLFAFPEVEAVRWTQDTPSFNDGDPCEFGTNEFYVKLVDGDDTEGENEDGYLTEYCIDAHFTKVDGVEYTWRDDRHHPIAKALDAAFDYNRVKAYYHALEEAFGDPAEIVATRAGFQLEYYEGSY